MIQSDQTSMAMMSSPPKRSPDFRDDSTLDQDVFDGIEDIYVDLEAVPPPPPPSSKDDILDSPRVNLSSSTKSSSLEFMNQESTSNNDSVEYGEGQFPYICGIQSSKDSPRLTNLWNIFKIQSYFEMDEDNKKKIQKEPSQKIGETENIGTHTTNKEVENEVERKKTTAEKKPDESEAPKTVVARDTIIQHTIDDDEGQEEQVKKIYQSVRNILREKTPFGVSKDDGPSPDSARENAVESTTDGDDARKEQISKVYPRFLELLRLRKSSGDSEGNDESSVVSARDAIMQRNADEDSIRKEKMKKYYPSFWDVLGQRKLFGISYRILLLAFFNLFAFILLIILVARFTGRNTTESESFANEGMGNNTASTDASSIEDEGTYFDDDGAGEITSELRALCDEDGVTAENGVILSANQVLEKGEYFCSPSRTYILGMMDDLAIVDIRANEVVWSAGVSNGARTALQADGTLVIQNEEGEILWNTEAIPRSDGFFNRQLVFWDNNEGLIAIQQTPTIGETGSPSKFWMDGVPSSVNCDDCQTDNLEFPVRGSLYFPLFDNTERAWQDRIGGLPVHNPTLGLYSSSDPDVVTAHIEALEYGSIDLAISFWEGAGTNYDRSRITMLLEETKKQNTGLKWTVSHEASRSARLTSDEIKSDLEYLKKWFAWHDSWARIEGKPVIYVNNAGSCDIVDRWMEEASGWYVVLRIFDGYERCGYQPDSWHDQRVNVQNDGVDIREGLYYNLAPGQWSVGRRRPELERLSPGEWCDYVQAMVDSNEQWQMILSFNDAILGTSIEPSADWRSASRYGFFLDCLHDPQMF